MNQPTGRKTYKEKLRPTPAHERTLDEVLWCCRTHYNAALEQRITAYQRCHVSVSRFAQGAELKAIREELPEYAAIHSHVLQDVLARLRVPVGKWSRSSPRSRAKCAQAVAVSCRRACPCGGTPARTAARASTATRTPPGTSNGPGSAFEDSRGYLRG